MMSTEFFRLRLPFTSARLTVGGGHTHTLLALWVNHAKTGEIILRNEEVPHVLRALSMDNAAVTRHGIGGTSLSVDDDDIEDDTTSLVSEYGELTCLAELKRLMTPCVICRTQPRDGYRLCCTSPACVAELQAVALVKIEAIRRQEAIEAMRTTNGGAAYVHTRDQ